MAKKSTAVAAAEPADAGAAPPPPSRVRCPLRTVDDVKAELARVYRNAKGGQMRIEDASRLANVLAILARLIEGAEFDARLAAIEADRAATDR